MDADEAFFSRIGVNLRDLRASLDSTAACIRVHRCLSVVKPCLTFSASTAEVLKRLLPAEYADGRR
jgi:hypothetical protein